jgi:hypothetical protein
MRAMIELKIDHEIGELAVIQKEYDMPDTLFNKSISIKLQFANSINITNRFKVNSYDTISGLTHLKTSSYDLDFCEYSEDGKIDSFFKELKSLGWKVVIDEVVYKEIKFPTKLKPAFPKNRPNFSDSLITFILFNVCALIVYGFLMTRDIEIYDLKFIVLGSCVGAYITHWVRRYIFDKKAIAYLKQVKQLWK